MRRELGSNGAAFPAKAVEGTFHTQHLPLALANVGKAGHVIMGYWLQFGFHLILPHHPT